MTETSTTDNPATTQDVATSGDDLTTMVADQFEKHGQPSKGEPSSTTEPDAPTDTAGQPDSEVKPDTTEGKTTRLEQRLADQKKFLISLGIDPDSDTIDRFNAGLITKEQLLPTPQVPQTPQAPQTGIEKLEVHRTKIRDKIGKGQELLQQDFLESLDIMGELASDNVKITQQTNMRNLISDCERATDAVLAGDELHSVIPEDIQEIESQVFLGSTDNFLSAETHGDPHYLTPKSYNFYGQKNIQNYRKLRNAWIDYGKSLVKGSPPEPIPQVNPISSGTGSAPMKPPEKMINIDNMGAAARAYQQNQTIV